MWKQIISIPLAIITGVLTWLGILVAAIIVFPAQMEHYNIIQNIPFGQWTMGELNLVLGVAILVVIATIIAFFAGIFVLCRVGDW